MLTGERPGVFHCACSNPLLECLELQIVGYVWCFLFFLSSLPLFFPASNLVHSSRMSYTALGVKAQFQHPLTKFGALDLISHAGYFRDKKVYGGRLY